MVLGRLVPPQSDQSIFCHEAGGGDILEVEVRRAAGVKSLRVVAQ